MFSGIIQEKLIPTKWQKNKESIILSFPIPKNWDIKEGESISIDGVCSTVTTIENNTFSVFYMQETIRKTTLEKLADTHAFNLERCLRLNDVISGHLVSGHVDITALVVSIKNEGEAKVISFSLDPQFTKYIVYKGSITVNGVSLTIVNVTKDSFTVSLIPYTLTHTNLGTLQINNVVNIEVDMIAKYIEKLHIP